MISLHVFDISVMRKQACCGQLGIGLYTLQWWKMIAQKDKSSVLIELQIVRMEQVKIGNTQKENQAI